MQPFEYNEDQTDLYPGQASRKLPGAPPEIFEEWDEPREYEEEVSPWAQTNGRSGLDDGGVVQSIYGGAELPLFGPQYGISQPSRINAQDFPGQDLTVMRVEASNSYEDMMRNADADLERAYLESLKPAKGHGTQANPTFVT
jgi:hypothetical protein